jgi:hypothetical protein
VVVEAVDAAVAGAAVKGTLADTGLADMAEIFEVDTFHFLFKEDGFAVGKLDAVGGIDFGGDVPADNLSEEEGGVEAAKQYLVLLLLHERDHPSNFERHEHHIDHGQDLVKGGPVRETIVVNISLFGSCDKRGELLALAAFLKFVGRCL